MSTLKNSKSDLFEESLARWGGVTDAVFSTAAIPPPQKWLYAVLAIYALATTALGIARADWYTHAFLLAAFLPCIIYSLIGIRFETKRRRRKNPPEPRPDAPCERNDRGSASSQ